MCRVCWLSSHITWQGRPLICLYCKVYLYKLETLDLRWFNAGPPSTTPAQHQTNIGPTSRVSVLLPCPVFALFIEACRPRLIFYRGEGGGEGRLVWGVGGVYVG